MERVHDPPRAVGGDNLDSAPLLSGELVEKQIQHILAVLLVGPYQPSPVVVDNDNQVLVVLLVGGLIDPDAPCALEAPLAARGLQIGVDARAHLTERVPLHARAPRQCWPDPCSARHATHSQSCT